MFSRSITITIKIIVKLLVLLITITYYYYPISVLNKAPYHRHDVVKTSPRHRQEITIIPRRVAEGSPTVADSKSTSLTVSRCSADQSPNIPRRCIGDASPKVRQYIACEFSRGTTRSTSAPIATRTRLFHRQYIARHFGLGGP